MFGKLEFSLESLFQGGEESVETGLEFVGDIKRADDAFGFADDGFSLDESEVSRIPAVVPVVAHDEIMIIRYDHRPEVPHGGK